MKIRKVINHSGTGGLYLPMFLAANFFSCGSMENYAVSFQYF